MLYTRYYVDSTMPSAIGTDDCPSDEAGSVAQQVDDGVCNLMRLGKAAQRSG